MESVLTDRPEEMFKNKGNVSFEIPEEFQTEQTEQTIIYNWNGGNEHEKERIRRT